MQDGEAFELCSYMLWQQSYSWLEKLLHTTVFLLITQKPLWHFLTHSIHMDIQYRQNDHFNLSAENATGKKRKCFDLQKVFSQPQWLNWLVTGIHRVLWRNLLLPFPISCIANNISLMASVTMKCQPDATYWVRRTGQLFGADTILPKAFVPLWRGASRG